MSLPPDLPRFITLSALHQRGWRADDIARHLDERGDARLQIAAGRTEAIYSLAHVRVGEHRDRDLKARVSEVMAAKPIAMPPRNARITSRGWN